MKISSIDALFVDNLSSIYDVEQQLTAALRTMADASSTPELRQAFEQHLSETKEHAVRVQEILKDIGERPGQKRNPIVKQMIESAEHLIQQNDEGAVRDAALIVSGNQIEHFEMACYGSLRSFARLLGREDAAAILDKSLEEEKRADNMLTEIGEQQVNLRAIHEEAASAAKHSERD